MKKIKLTQGTYVLVDEMDFEWLNQWKWHLSCKGYAVRKPGKSAIFMHRLINNTPEGLQTDHINRNKLDNRRKNLRTLNNQKNHFNMPRQKNNKSGVTGVLWDKERNKWLAQIVINDKAIHLGRYPLIDDAIVARQKAERMYHVI